MAAEEVTSPIEPIITEENRLILAGRDIYLIPEEIYQYAGKVTALDLSYNCMNDLEGLSNFSPKLHELVLDNNEINDATEFPQLPQLTLLSLSNNKITDLYKFLDNVEGKFPKLTYLSLLGNRACPDSIAVTDCDEADYLRYRKYVIYKFPGLKFLDSKPVSRSERSEAKKQGPFLRVVRPPLNNGGIDEESMDTDYNPLPMESDTNKTGVGTYRRSKYIYHGKYSEGNRFIRNDDL